MYSSLLMQARQKLYFFRPKTKTITKDINFRISGQKVNIAKQTKYLGIYLDEHLKWNFQLDQIKSKLSRSCGLLAKLRYITKTDLLRAVYFAIFDSILRYGGSIEIKQLNKLNKFNKRPSEFKPKNVLETKK